MSVARPENEGLYIGKTSEYFSQGPRAAPSRPPHCHVPFDILKPFHGLRGNLGKNSPSLLRIISRLSPPLLRGNISSRLVRLIAGCSCRQIWSRLECGFRIALKPTAVWWQGRLPLPDMDMTKERTNIKALTCKQRPQAKTQSRPTVMQPPNMTPRPKKQGRLSASKLHLIVLHLADHMMTSCSRQLQYLPQCEAPFA